MSASHWPLIQTLPDFQAVPWVSTSLSYFRGPNRLLSGNQHHPLDDVPESDPTMTRRDPAEGLVFTGLPEPDEPQLPDDLCQFCYELADEMAVHNQSDVLTEYGEIHHHAHGKADQAGNQ